MVRPLALYGKNPRGVIPYRILENLKMLMVAKGNTWILLGDVQKKALYLRIILHTLILL